MIPVFRNASACFHDSTRGDLAMADISREGVSSLRASATIEMRRVRPRSEPTRWRNQQLRALAGWYLTHIQASSIIVVRRRGLPAFEMPCSWSMLPLFHGLGARPASGASDVATHVERLSSNETNKVAQ